MAGRPNASLLPIAGLDTGAGLEHVAGDHAFYLKLLGRFARSHRDAACALRASATTENWQQLALLAHSLRGSAAAIGATTLRQDAARLEQHAASQAPWAPRDAERLAADLEELVAGLRRHLAPASAPATAADARQVHAVRARLAAVLAEFSGDAPDFFDESRHVLAAVLAQPALAQLADHIERYEFDAARVLLLSHLPDDV